MEEGHVVKLTLANDMFCSVVMKGHLFWLQSFSFWVHTQDAKLSSDGHATLSDTLADEPCLSLCLKKPPSSTVWPHTMLRGFPVSLRFL